MQGYYDTLKKVNLPHPGNEQIEKDLIRTDVKQLEMEFLGNILRAFVVRNPTVGYCQGMNFLVARLYSNLKSEEQAFWVLTQIVEQILPPDYYANLIGVLVDQKVVQRLMEEKLPRLCETFDQFPEVRILLDQKIFKWLMVLFVGELSPTVETYVWDLFFIKGSIVIIRVALTVLQFF